MLINNRCMATSRVHRFCHCLHMQMLSHLRLSPFIHGHARDLACWRKPFLFANWSQPANWPLKFAGGYNSRMGRNMYMTRPLRCRGEGEAPPWRQGAGWLRSGFAEECRTGMGNGRICEIITTAIAMPLQTACSRINITDNTNTYL